MSELGDRVRVIHVAYHAMPQRELCAIEADTLETFVEAIKGAHAVWESDYASNDEDAGSSFAYQVGEHIRALEKKP